MQVKINVTVFRYFKIISPKWAKLFVKVFLVVSSKKHRREFYLQFPERIGDLLVEVFRVLQRSTSIQKCRQKMVSLEYL